jgi:hypothetical protein
MTEAAKAGGRWDEFGEDWNAAKAEVLKIATGEPGNAALRDVIAEELEAKWDGAREVVIGILDEAVAEAERKAKAAPKVIVLGAKPVEVMKRRRLLDGPKVTVPRQAEAAPFFSRRHNLRSHGLRSHGTPR